MWNDDYWQLLRERSVSNPDDTSPLIPQTSDTIFTCRIGDSLRAGDDIEITVLNIKGDDVELGFKVPREFAAFTEEKFQRLSAEMKAPRG